MPGNVSDKPEQTGQHYTWEQGQCLNVQHWQQMRTVRSFKSKPEMQILLCTQCECYSLLAVQECHIPQLLEWASTW